MLPAPAKLDRLAQILKPALADGAFRVDRARPLTFICGARTRDGISTLRQQFLDRASAPPARIVPVLAESTFAHQLLEQNIQRYEQFLASAADCVLVFVESPGSFAETGLFAALEGVLPKTFVVNTRAEADQDSFLNNGPIKLIRRASKFDKVFELADGSVTEADAEAIIERIVARCPRYKYPLVFQGAEKFGLLDFLLQLGCVHVAVTMLRAASSGLVTRVLQRRFRAVDEPVVEKLLSLLAGIKVLQRADELYFNPRPEGLVGDSLIAAVEFSADTVRARALDWQARHDAHAAAFIREDLGVGL